jgi:uncharacterized SAM-binding protein YcdF (DUF218 family)
MLAGPWHDPSGDVLIVLGGSGVENGILGESSYLRVKYGILAYREGNFHAIVLSGGGPAVPISVAMRDFMACSGVPRSIMITETASASTRESALYTKKLLEGVPGTKVLLTSDFHMFRAHRAFHKAGLEVLPCPFPDVRKRAVGYRGRWPAFLDLVEESIKIAYYYGRGWI